MEVEWVADRARLLHLIHHHPDWTVRELHRQFSLESKRCFEWVRKWYHRLKGCALDTIPPLLSHSRRRKTPYIKVSEAVEARIIDLRDTLSQEYNRRVGARNILYHLQKDEDLKRLQAYIPTSTSTITAILHKYQRICIVRCHRHPLMFISHRAPPKLVKIASKRRYLWWWEMEEQWIIDRAKLHRLLREKPHWTNQQYADACGRCRSWVKKWKKRLRGRILVDERVLHSQSRARKTLPEPYHPEVIECILALRDQPPIEVPRKIGPRTILYFLHHDQMLANKGHRLPRSSSTIWKILDQHQRIIRQPKVVSLPFERPEPMDTWEIDFTDVSGAKAQHDQKIAHQVEAFAVVDRGTSILVDLQVSDSYQAKTALVAMASTLIQHGLPKRMVFDRDPRFIGSWSADDFPSAFMRFLMCLDIAVDVCPPRRPDLKPFVERYFRTLNSECVQIKHPANVTQAREVFEAHHFTYNHERPHQATVCGNRPPYKAFTQLPRLPHIPETLDPDQWLAHYHTRLYKRRVDHSGRVQIDKHRYYIQRRLAGRYVVCKLNADHRVFDVILDNKTIKTIPLKGLYDEPMLFGDYLDMMMKEAEAEHQRLARNRRFRVS